MHALACAPRPTSCCCCGVPRLHGGGLPSADRQAGTPRGRTPRHGTSTGGMWMWWWRFRGAWRSASYGPCPCRPSPPRLLPARAPTQPHCSPPSPPPTSHPQGAVAVLCATWANHEAGRVRRGRTYMRARAGHCSRQRSAHRCKAKAWTCVAAGRRVRKRACIEVCVAFVHA